MTDDDREFIAGLCNRLPFVRWDRLTPIPWSEGCERIAVYGWIARDDGRSDFVLLDVWVPAEEGRGEVVERPVAATSSSSEYSEEIARRLWELDDGEPGAHIDCVRVEHELPGVVEVIHL